MLVLGCGAEGTESAPVQPLAGEWRVELTVDASPRPAPDVGRTMYGNVAFVPSDSSSPSTGRSYGAYSLTPEAELVVGRPSDHRAQAVCLGSDTIVITLGADTAPLELRGALRSDSIVGTWNTELGRSASARGRFMMRRTK